MQKIVVAVTGASGSIYARQLLTKLLQAKEQMEELSLVMSDNAQKVWQTELGSDSYKNLPIKIFDKKDFMAPFASGSAQYSTMIIIPCSMGTLGRIAHGISDLGRIAHGISDDLITRTADVMLKERRKLICVARETPYNLIQIKNMELLTHAGGIICPATHMPVVLFARQRHRFTAGHKPLKK